MTKNLFTATVMTIAMTFAAIPMASAQTGRTINNGQNNRGTCNSSAAIKSLSKEFLKKCQQEGEKNSTACVASQIFAKVRGALNVLANNGSLTIGARKIEFNKAQSGTLVSPGNRIFVSAYPLPLEATKVKVSIKKTGSGQATAGVHICAIDPANPDSATPLGAFAFNATREVGDTEFMEVTGAQGKFLQVFLDGTGGLGNKLPLEFKVECSVCK